MEAIQNQLKENKKTKKTSLNLDDIRRKYGAYT